MENAMLPAMSPADRRRVVLLAADLGERYLRLLDARAKHNPCHDADGRFCHTGGGKGRTPAEKAKERRLRYRRMLVAQFPFLEGKPLGQLMSPPGPGRPATHEHLTRQQMGMIETLRPARTVRRHTTYTAEGILETNVETNPFHGILQEESRFNVEHVLGGVAQDNRGFASRRAAYAYADRDHARLAREIARDFGRIRPHGGKSLGLASKSNPHRDARGRFARSGSGAHPRAHQSPRKVRGPEHAERLRLQHAERREHARDVRREQRGLRREHATERRDLARTQHRDAVALDREQSRDSAKLIRHHERESAKNPASRTLASRHEAERAELAEGHAQARRDLASEHATDRRNLREEHREAVTDQRREHLEGIASLRRSQREDLAETLRGIRDERNEGKSPGGGGLATKDRRPPEDDAGGEANDEAEDTYTAIREHAERILLGERNLSRKQASEIASEIEWQFRNGDAPGNLMDMMDMSIDRRALVQ